MALLDYLILAVTDRCNLRCTYCYRDAEAEGMDMPLETVKKALALVHHDRPAHIQITGGEPLLVPDLLQYIGEHISKMAGKPHIALQTNGTLLSRDIALLLKHYGVQIGVSVDGPPDLQNRNRGQADATLRGLRLLESMGIEFRVTTVLSRENVDRLDQLAMLLAGFSNSRGIGLDILVNRGRANGFAGNELPSVEQMERGIGKLVRALACINRNRFIPLQLREAGQINRGGGSFCFAAAGRSFAITPQGKIFPCGQTMNDPDFFLGTIDELTSLTTSSLGNIRLASTDCLQCSLQKSCPGDCPSRLYYNGEAGHKLACAMYRTIDVTTHRSPLFERSRPAA